MFNLLATSAGCSASRGCFQCQQTGSGCWSSCPHSRSLYLLLCWRARSAAGQEKNNKKNNNNTFELWTLFSKVHSFSAEPIYTYKKFLKVNEQRLLFWETAWPSPPYLRPGIHDIKKSAVVIGFADGLQHALILEASCTEPRERLTTTTHCCLSG